MEKCEALSQMNGRKGEHRGIGVWVGGSRGLGFNYQYHKAGTGFTIHRNLDIYLFVNTRDLGIVQSEAADSWTSQALMAMLTSRGCDPCGLIPL